MKIVHNIPNGIHEMKREYTEEVAVLFADTFLEMNQIWSSANLDKAVLKEFFIKEINDHMDSEERVRQRYNNPNIWMNQVLFYNQRIVACTLHMELDEYRQAAKNSKESEIPLFRELEREGKELIKAVDLSTFESGKYVYASWGAQYRIPELKAANKLHDIATLYSQMYEQGFKGMIFRSSNEKIIQFHTFLGGEVLKEVPFAIKDKVCKLWFMQEDFGNPKMQKMMEEVKNAHIAQSNL